MTPNMTIFGIQETKANANKFVPHYKVLANKLYPKSNLVLLNPRSVMFTRESFGTFDFWNLDSDFFFAEDALSFNEMMNYGGNHFAYFSLFLKVLRIAHGHYDEDFLKQEWTKNKAHLLDIYSNCVISDVIMVSPVLRAILHEKMPQLIGDVQMGLIESKMLVLPPPDLYKFGFNEPAKKSFKTLTFIWNHRLNAAKNPKAFFGIISQFVAAYPKVPVKILLLSSLTESELHSAVPQELHQLLEVRPYAYDDAAYAQALRDSNITIGTSLAESYGIAILEVAASGSVVLNLDCNQAYAKIIGDRTTFKAKEVVDRIYRVWSDKEYRDRLLAYTKKGLSSIPDAEHYREAITTRLGTVFQNRLDRTSAKSPKLQAVLKALDKKALTKNEVYEVMGWKSTGAPINTFWGDYYYGLRKLGVNVGRSKQDGRLYFYTAVKPKPGQAPAVAAKASKGKAAKSLFG